MIIIHWFIHPSIHLFIYTFILSFVRFTVCQPQKWYQTHNMWMGLAIGQIAMLTALFGKSVQGKEFFFRCKYARKNIVLKKWEIRRNLVIFIQRERTGKKKLCCNFIHNEPLPLFFHKLLFPEVADLKQTLLIDKICTKMIFHMCLRNLKYCKWTVYSSLLNSEEGTTY